MFWLIVVKRVRLLLKLDSSYGQYLRIMFIEKFRVLDMGTRAEPGLSSSSTADKCLRKYMQMSTCTCLCTTPLARLLKCTYCFLHLLFALVMKRNISLLKDVWHFDNRRSPRGNWACSLFGLEIFHYFSTLQLGRGQKLQTRVSTEVIPVITSWLEARKRSILTKLFSATNCLLMSWKQFFVTKKLILTLFLLRCEKPIPSGRRTSHILGWTFWAVSNEAATDTSRVFSFFLFHYVSFPAGSHWKMDLRREQIPVALLGSTCTFVCIHSS